MAPPVIILLAAGDINCTDSPAADASVFDELDFTSLIGVRLSSMQFLLRILQSQYCVNRNKCYKIMCPLII